jgi:hypothetical protein
MLQAPETRRQAGERAVEPEAPTEPPPHIIVHANSLTQL